MSDACLRGINWGQLSLTGTNLQLTEDGKKVIQLPLKQINNCQINKQDITLELKTGDNIDNDTDCLCEIRFFVPQKAKEDNKDGSDEDQDEEDSQKSSQQSDEAKESFAKKIFQEIMQKTNAGQFTGDSLVTITDLQLTVPRGKYTLDMYKESLRLHGASYNYVIEYKNIIRSFLLPNVDELHMSYVIGLDQPIKQGNTSYPYIIINLLKEEPKEPIVVRGTEQERKDLQLEESYKREMYQIVGMLFKNIAKISIFVPGNFKSKEEHSCVKCNLKTTQGFLYPLQKSLIFIQKPVVYIPHKEIKKIEFQRIGGGMKTKFFDIKIVTKAQAVDLQGLDVDELQILMAYFDEKKIPVDTKADASFGGKARNLRESDDDDDSFDDESDSRKLENAERRRAKVSGNKGLSAMQGDDYDEDEEDSDFEVGEDDDDSDDEIEDDGDEDDDDDFDEDSGDKKKSKNKKNDDSDKKKKKKKRDEE